jgi:DNA polymerase IV
MFITSPPTRKIIHIDMDCFFAAIEIRDKPALRNQPVAVGGLPSERGVLTTCNYIARKFGLHSAMASFRALQLCPKLILLPVDMDKYQKVAQKLYRIFRQYTPLVETLSLDEAFLDVTNCPYCKGSATLIAQVIKRRIKKELNLTASAGVAPNKFLAKVASDWQKPDGLFVITPNQVDDFVKQLPVTEIFGVGKVTAKKLHDIGIFSCADLQKKSLLELQEDFGKLGERLFELCRGIDERSVETEYVRKSLSVEETFPVDLHNIEDCLAKIPALVVELKRRLEYEQELIIAKQFVKIKFYDFSKTTAEQIVMQFDENYFIELFKRGFERHNKPIRLLGVGVRFKEIE